MGGWKWRGWGEPLYFVCGTYPVHEKFLRKSDEVAPLCCGRRSSDLGDPSIEVVILNEKPNDALIGPFPGDGNRFFQCELITHLSSRLSREIGY